MGGIRRHSACLYPCRSFLCQCFSFRHSSQENLLLSKPMLFFLSFPSGESASVVVFAFLSVIPSGESAFVQALAFLSVIPLRRICFWQSPPPRLKKKTQTRAQPDPPAPTQNKGGKPPTPASLPHLASKRKTQIRAPRKPGPAPTARTIPAQAKARAQARRRPGSATHKKRTRAESPHHPMLASSTSPTGPRFKHLLPESAPSDQKPQALVLRERR